jgi:hypothetical protein
MLAQVVQSCQLHPLEAGRAHLNVNLRRRPASDSYVEGEAALGVREVPTDERHPLWSRLRAFDPERAPWRQVWLLSPIETKRTVQRRADLDAGVTPHHQAALCPEPTTVVVEVPAPLLIEVPRRNLERLAFRRRGRYSNAAVHNEVSRWRLLRIVHRPTEGDGRFDRWMRGRTTAWLLSGRRPMRGARRHGQKSRENGCHCHPDAPGFPTGALHLPIIPPGARR